MLFSWNSFLRLKQSPKEHLERDHHTVLRATVRSQTSRTTASRIEISPFVSSIRCASGGGLSSSHIDDNFDMQPSPIISDSCGIRVATHQGQSLRCGHWRCEGAFQLWNKYQLIFLSQHSLAADPPLASQFPETSMPTVEHLRSCSLLDIRITYTFSSKALLPNAGVGRMQWRLMQCSRWAPGDFGRKGYSIFTCQA